jgi:hypothetical protein
MKVRTILLTCAALLVLGSASYAQDERPLLGVRLDPAPLPELLAKHLGLDPGQGIRISNVAVGRAADRAGIERDDVIIAFGDRKITSHEQLVDAIGKAGVDSEVSLEVIHLGQRKTLQIKLEPARGEEVEWKYPPEPEAVTSWRPGKIFKIGPDGREWLEIPFDKMPEFDVDVRKFSKELHTYHHSKDGEEYAITIEGNPEDKDTRIVVGADGKKYAATVGTIDELPEKYRAPAKEAVENARRDAKKDVRIRGKFNLPEPPRPEIYRKYLEAFPRLDMERFSEQKDRALEKLQEQMERLQQRMQELEEQHKEMFDRILERLELKKEKTERPEKPASSEPESKQAI